MLTLAEPNLETLRPPGDPDAFVEYGYRPLFKEHINRAGQKVGEPELTRITDCCNDRIIDTGDFSPLVIRHTKDDGTFDPEVIGLVGPYRMGKFGNKKPLPCSYGKLWVYPHKVDELKKYPRLSVEFWADANDPGNGYFDPISLLGAETPELDLGVHYLKDRHSDRQLMRYRKVERFQAVYPGGANTSVPGLIGDERAEDRDDKGTITQQQQFSKGTGGMLTAEDIQQIVAAIKPIVTQQVDEAMAGMKAAIGDEAPEGDAELNLEEDDDLDLDDSLDGLDDDQPNEDGDDADLEDDDSPPEIDEELPAEGDENEQPGGEVAEAEEEPETPEPSDADEEEDDMAAVADKDKKPKKPDQYERQPHTLMTREQYAKENRELREKYEKSETRAKAAEERLAAVETQVAEIKTDKVRAQRYAKLADLRTSGYVVDVDQELEDAKGLTDEQFERQCTKIVERYARAPIGHSLPIPKSEMHDGTPRDEKRTRYSKVAREVCLDAQKTGKTLDYGTVLANVERNDGKYVAA